MRKVTILANVIVSVFYWTSHSMAQPEKIDVEKYPDILSVKVQPRGDNHFDFDVTVSSPYDTQQRYADAFRVMSVEGVVFGERKLWHDHGDEQPFTRDLYGLFIRAGIKNVVIQGHDQKYGYGGKTVTIALPGR